MHLTYDQLLQSHFERDPSNELLKLSNQTKESTMAQFKHSYLQSQSLQLKLSAQKMLEG